MSETPAQKIGVGFAISFYGVMAALGYLFCWIFDVDPFVLRKSSNSLWFRMLIGGGFGIVVVLVSSWFTRKFIWAQRLSETLRKTLGRRSFVEIFFFALASGLGEEILFRGALQHILTMVLFDGGIAANIFGILVASFVFGMLHTGPERSVFFPWTIFAIVVGAMLGALYWWTGDLVAPVTAHFTINFFNLHLICNREEID